jgi:hypothetical protein
MLKAVLVKKATSIYRMKPFFSGIEIKFSGKICFSVIIMFNCVSCKTDKENIISEQVSERVAAFKIKQNAECRASLMHDAEQIVDSILLEEAKGQLNDSLMRLRPFKPPQPIAVPPIDTNPVSPLFPEPASSTRNGG